MVTHAISECPKFSLIVRASWEFKMSQKKVLKLLKHVSITGDAAFVFTHSAGFGDERVG